MIDEAGILMAEAIVILAPDVRREQIVQRGDRAAPRNPLRHFQPLGVLIEHGIDDVNERLVTGKEPVSAGEQVPFEPSLALVLAEHLHHATVWRNMIVSR